MKLPTLNALSALTPLLLLLLATPGMAETSSGIHVSGHGSIEVAPDMGTVRLQIRREGAHASELKAELDEIVRSVLELSRELSIAERDVAATIISLNPRYRRRDNESIVDGLQASRTISVTLRDLEKFGDLLNRALALGINSVEPIQLDSSDRASLENDALRLAMEDATEEALRVAAGFSVPLGSVIDVQVGSHSARPMVATAMRADVERGAAFSPGVIRIERSLSATFAIETGSADDQR